jgi:hypothetical protein
LCNTRLRANVMSMRLQTANPMIPAGEFLPRQRPVGNRFGWIARVGVLAALVCVLAAIGSVAALLLWLVSVLLPVALIAGVVAYAAFRLQFGTRLGTPRAS